jgi:hypothetical protein
MSTELTAGSPDLRSVKEGSPIGPVAYDARRLVWLWPSHGPIDGPRWGRIAMDAWLAQPQPDTGDSLARYWEEHGVDLVLDTTPWGLVLEVHGIRGAVERASSALCDIPSGFRLEEATLALAAERASARLAAGRVDGTVLVERVLQLGLWADRWPGERDAELAAALNDARAVRTHAHGALDLMAARPPAQVRSLGIDHPFWPSAPPSSGFGATHDRARAPGVAAPRMAAPRMAAEIEPIVLTEPALRHAHVAGGLGVDGADPSAMLALEIVADMIAGDPGSPWLVELRERAELTYAVRTVFRPAWLDGRPVCMLGLSAQVSDLERALAVVGGLMLARVSQDFVHDVARARRRLGLGEALFADSRRKLAARRGEPVAYGLDEAYWNRRAAALSRSSRSLADDVVATLGRARAVVTGVGPVPL